MSNAATVSPSSGDKVRDSVLSYLDAGWALCSMPYKKKAPNYQGWNRLENAISRKDQAGRITGNVGLLHAFSGTAAVDVDDALRAKPFLHQHGIDLDQLLCEPTAVLISSGRQNRFKLLYKHSQVLPYCNLTSCGIELRCGDSKGGSMQDVLPPSIHPSGNPYRWVGNGHFSRLPNLPPKLQELWLSSSKFTPDISMQWITEGSRNNSLTSIAGSLRFKGKDEEEIIKSLLAVNDNRCKPPLRSEEVISIAKSVSRYETGSKIDDVGAIEDGDPLLPEGTYRVRYKNHEIIEDMHGFGSKIVVRFEIIEGESNGLVIRAFYNINLLGKKWLARPGSRLSREICRLFPDVRKDRISPACLNNHIIVAKVGTTKTGTYSVIRELLELAR